MRQRQVLTGVPVPGPVEFRNAERADALCVGVLAIQVFLDTYATEGLRADLAREALAGYGTAAFARRIGDPSNHFDLAERSGHLLAFSECRMSTRPPHPSLAGSMELVRLYVQRRAQRQGLGGSLLSRAEAHARERASPLLWLTAWSGNVVARTFYLAQGYEDIGATAYVFEQQAYENRIFRKMLIG